MLSPQVHIPFDKIEGYMDYLKELRLNPEIYFKADVLDKITFSDIENIKKLLDYNPQFTIHAPFMDLCPGAVDSKVRAATVERFSQVLDMAEILRPKAVVFHSGYEKWKYALKVDVWLKESIRTWSPIIERASDMDVKIAVENIFEDEPDSLRHLMEHIGSSYFGICFDTGHCNLFSKLPLKDWLGALKDYIIELHIHDNDKSYDSHLSLGDGTFAFKELFSTLRDRDIIYTIESHTPEMVLRSIERLKAYLPDSSGQNP